MPLELLECVIDMGAPTMTTAICTLRSAVHLQLTYVQVITLYLARGLGGNCAVETVEANNSGVGVGDREGILF